MNARLNKVMSGHPELAEFAKRFDENTIKRIKAENPDPAVRAREAAARVAVYATDAYHDVRLNETWKRFLAGGAKE